MLKRPCHVHIGDFVRVRKYEDVYGYVTGIDEEEYTGTYYIEIDIGMNKEPLYLYDDALEVIPIIKE
jgi:hypothetical protein